MSFVIFYCLEANNMFLPHSRREYYAGYEPHQAVYQNLHLLWNLAYSLYLLRQKFYISRLSMVTFSSILGQMVINSNIIMKYPVQTEKFDIGYLKIYYS